MMRKIMILLLIAVGHVSIASDGPIQDGTSKYKEVMKALGELQQLSYTANFSYFNHHRESAPNEVTRAEFSMSGTDYFWKIGSSEIQKGPEYLIMVDHEEKVLMLDRVTGFQVPEQTNMMAMIDSLLGKVDSIHLLNESASNISFRIYTNTEGIPYSDVTFNWNTGWFDQITLYFQDYESGQAMAIGNKLEIEYLEVSKARAAANSHLSPKRYFSFKENGVIPVKAYADYDLLNHLETDGHE